MKRIVLCALFMVIAAGARAGAPTGPHVDPKAPCYRWPAVDWDEDGVFDRVDKCPNTPHGCSVDQWGCSLDGDGDGVCDGLDQCPNTPAGLKVDKDGCAEIERTRMSARSAPTPAREAPPPQPPPPPPPAPVSPMERNLIETGSIRLENVYFESGSNKLLPESESTLDEAGSVLEKFADVKVEVQGHTDTRGPAAYNMKLSQKRAEAVRQYLLDHFHLRPENYTARGYGETQPETRERNEEELLRNRRVVLKVTNPEVLPRGVEVTH
ncbi:MAG TPA: OmpA family protein [Candidatus Sulfotelmatobacter sp.]|nr:OmpA family protein [Candidatus Sulfotelmatobacter sp.]